MVAQAHNLIYPLLNFKRWTLIYAGSRKSFVLSKFSIQLIKIVKCELSVDSQSNSAKLAFINFDIYFLNMLKTYLLLMFTIFDSLPPHCTIDQSLTESILSQRTSQNRVNWLVNFTQFQLNFYAKFTAIFNFLF